MALELQFFQLFIIIPFLGFVLSLFIPGKKETLISWAAFSTVGLHFFLALAFVAHWVLNGHATLNLKEIVLYESSEYSFFVDFYFDKITAVYLCVGALLTFMVTLYSRYYMHRESG